MQSIDIDTSRSRRPFGAPVDLLRADHKAKMIRKKAQRENRVTGFLPMPNGRLQKWAQRHLALLLVRMNGKSQQELAIAGLPANVAEAKDRADRHACRFLTASPMVRSHQPRPSKNDDPAYRKPIVPKRLRAAASA